MRKHIKEACKAIDTELTFGRLLYDKKDSKELKRHLKAFLAKIEAFDDAQSKGNTPKMACNLKPKMNQYNAHHFDGNGNYIG